MADSTASAPPSRIASTPVFVATFAAVLGVIALLLVFDLSLARIDRQESESLAATQYQTGLALLAKGDAGEAADRFGNAVAIERTNATYSLALAQAMLAQNQLTDAEATLRALLDRAENDGAVNLAMAHVMVREGRPDDAQAYYHRAIFGRWGADSIPRRASARFELIEMLAGENRNRELLAELLPLEDTPPDSIALRKRLGQLFLIAGSPTRAANMFREVLRHNSGDADAYAGMGNAALALGNFRTGRADLAQAARLQPNDSAVAHSLAVADTLLALDPSARGTGRHERYLRARSVLERTTTAVARCGAQNPALADSAARQLQLPVRPAQEDEAGDSLLALSSDLWDSRSPRCGASAGDEVLGLLHARLDR